MLNTKSRILCVLKKLSRTAILIFLALITLAFTNVGDSIGKFIKTNYFDLPFGKVKELQSKLQTNDIELLPIQSASILGKYLSQKVLESPNPYGINMRSNYFWNIYNALPSFVSAKERHTGYNHAARNYSDSEQLMAYSIYRIDRSASNIMRIFEFFKPTLTTFVPLSVYKDLGIELYVEQAINSYKSITEIPNYSKLLQNAYTQVDTTTGSLMWEGDHRHFRKFENSAYGFSVDELNQIISGHMGLDRYSDLSYSPWLSFWMRRNHEGNMQQVYNILCEISKIYSPDTSDSTVDTYGNEVSHLTHQGKITYYKKWNDKFGENVLILSEQSQEDYAYEGLPSSNVGLFAYHYANSGDGFTLINKHTDNEFNCDFENRARFMEESVSITDLNNDGFSEVTFVYRLGCSSELSPDGLRLVTMDNRESYSIKGTTKVILDRRVPALGGETKIDEDFHMVDFRLLRNALEIWESQQENHGSFQKPRYYQLAQLERFHNLLAFGVEPYWTIRFDFDKLSYFELSQETELYRYTDIFEIDRGYRIIAEGLNTNDMIDISFSEGICYDGMSDYTYPYKIILTLKGNTYEGCARWIK